MESKIGPLVDTEEEWIAWEQARTKLAESQTDGAHARVIQWRANVQQPSASPATASQPLARPSQSQATLGFPVVKRSSLAKESKPSPRSSERYHESTSLHSKPPARQRTETQRAASPVPVGTREGPVDVDTSYTSHSKAEQNHLLVAAGNIISKTPLIRSPTLPSHSQRDFSVSSPCLFRGTNLLR